MKELQEPTIYSDIYDLADKILGEVLHANNDREINMRSLYDCYRSFETVNWCIYGLLKYYFAIENKVGSTLQNHLSKATEVVQMFLTDLSNVGFSDQKEDERAFVNKYWDRRLPFVVTIENYSCGEISSDNKSLKTNTIGFDDNNNITYIGRSYWIETQSDRKVLVSTGEVVFNKLENLRLLLREYLLKNLTATKLLK